MTTSVTSVETREQADGLVDLGCDLGQGWLYGRPVPASHIPRLLRSRGTLGEGATILRTVPPVRIEPESPVPIPH